MNNMRHLQFQRPILDQQQGPKLVKCKFKQILMRQRVHAAEYLVMDPRRSALMPRYSKGNPTISLIRTTHRRLSRLGQVVIKALT